MFQDAMSSWSDLSGALMDLEDAVTEDTEARIDALNSEIAFYGNILNTINDTYLGSLSYLNSIEKEVYASNLAEAYAESGDVNAQIEALKAQIENEKLTSTSREDYESSVELYIAQLQSLEYEDVEDEQLTELVAIKVELSNIKTAISRSSLQGVL